MTKLTGLIFYTTSCLLSLFLRIILKNWYAFFSPHSIHCLKRKTELEGRMGYTDIDNPILLPTIEIFTKLNKIGAPRPSQSNCNLFFSSSSIVQLYLK